MRLLKLPPCQIPVFANVEEGLLEGFRCRPDNKDCDVFLGIPYAAPPVGKLRFRKPVSVEPWKGIRRCKKFANRSIQRDQFWDKVVMLTPQSEDCLYLNVFAPSGAEKKSLPVLFYIHGGGFMMDSAAKYAYKDVCSQLTTKDMVVVTIQYRLGYLGYFSLANDTCKGNFGLWDQLMALQWTKRNIAAFGGDPDRITVGGQSAGGVSADLLSLSPLSRDLFHQKIVMGGSSFCHWAVNKGENISQFCRRKARKLGWRPKKQVFNTQQEEDEAMMDFLRKIPPHKFSCHMIGTKEVFTEARLPLSPVIDGEILPRPLEILRAESSPKPSISGVGEFESLLFIALGLIRCNGKFLDKIISFLARDSGGASMKEVREAIRDIYGDWNDASKKDVTKMCVTLLSDIISNYACYQFLQDAERLPTKTFAYSLDYTSRNMWGWMKAVVPYAWQRRGTHASELIYLFKCNYFVAPLPMDKKDRKVADVTSTLFANFVKFGDPNTAETRARGLQWDTVQHGRQQILSIQPEPRMLKEAFEGRMAKLDRHFRRLSLDRNYH